MLVGTEIRMSGICAPSCIELFVPIVILMVGACSFFPAVMFVGTDIWISGVKTAPGL